jgi:hypothetical protein
LVPLANLGVFDSPPEPQTDAEGVERVLPWPEGDYLVRIATDRPALVSTILTKLATTANPWVQRSMISVASKLPPTDANVLAPAIAKFVKSTNGWLNVEEVMTLVERLAAADEPASVKLLLKAMFDPKAGPEETMAFGTRTRVSGSIEDYFYTELLRRSVPILATYDELEGLRLVVGWLRKASRIQSGSRPERSDYDRSSIWRPSIAPHEQNNGLHELSDSLIDAVRDTALAFARAGHQIEVVDILDESKPFVMRRIGMEVAAQLLADDDPPDNLVQRASGLLVEHNLMGIGSRPEYVRLAKAALPRMDEPARSAWAQEVADQSWQGSDDEMRRMAAWGGKEPGDITPEDVAETRAHLLHRFLQPLEGSLPSVLQERLDELERENGKVEHGEFGSYRVSFTGPNSPKTVEELAAMSPDELVAYLKSWEPSGDRHVGPSVEGLARTLELVAETQPKLLAAAAGEISGLGRSYIRAALAGWTKAVSSGFVVPGPVWQLVREVVAQGDDGTDDDSHRDFEADDPVWRWAQRSVVDLIAATTGKLSKSAPPEQIDQLWALLKPLTSHADPTVEHEARYGGTNMDPLTLSLNTTRPAALRAAIRMALASHDQTQSELTATQVDILNTVGAHADGADDPSLAVAAVIGEGIGRVWDVDDSWVESRQAMLFPLLDDDDARRARADVIVSVALRTYHTGRPFLELMRPALLQMLTSRYAELDHTDGWREHKSPIDAAARHVISALMLQIVDRDDLLVRQLFSDDIPVAVISEALGHIGWSIMRTVMDGKRDDIPDEYLAQARGVIDWRVSEIRAGRAARAELSQFFWWARGDAFPPGWWLPILILATEETEQDMRGRLGESLADAARSEPGLAVKAFQQLYGSIDQPWRGYDLVQHSPRLLAAALRSGDAEAVDGANEIKDLLGRQGHFGALQELQQLLDNEASSG